MQIKIKSKHKKHNSLKKYNSKKAKKILSIKKKGVTLQTDETMVKSKITIAI